MEESVRCSAQQDDLRSHNKLLESEWTAHWQFQRKFSSPQARADKW